MNLSIADNNGDKDDSLNLSLSTTTLTTSSSSDTLSPLRSTTTTDLSYITRPHHHRGTAAGAHTSRRTTNQPTLRPGQAETITPPYPWATSRRAAVHDLQHLQANGISSITGDVQCKRCDRQYDVAFDLRNKFVKVAGFVAANRDAMRHRAPAAWMNPTLPDCRFCGQGNCVKPVLRKKKAINWLFLFLGQMIGCCKLSELKYFCKHTRNHRTGAKDRVLYLTYLEICRQLDPIGRYDP